MDAEPLKVYGARWCIDCFRAKRILDKLAIAYEWIDINHDQTAKKFVAEVNNGYLSVPTILFPDGSTLSEPTNAELRSKIEQMMNT
jgi:mycoredoxin